MPALVPMLVLGACADSARFGSSPFNTTGYGVAPPRVVAAPVNDLVTQPGLARSPEVISAPLPPVAGGALPPPGADPLSPGAMPPDALPGQNPSAALAGTPPGPVASLGAAPTTPAAPPPVVAPTRTAMTGSWRASEASGSGCRVTLSSAPSLDLYKASSSGCGAQDLKSVNAWDLRGNEIYLYARGTVVARLRGGGNSFNGVLAKSGAPVSLSR